VTSQLPLPISLQDVRSQILRPALLLLPARMTSPEAEVMLLAIGLQESRFRHRRQIRGPARGPARGLWQFELGGVRGVMTHAASRAHARIVCAARDVTFDAAEVYNRLEHDDVLAAAFARLLLWTDAEPLPKLGDTAAAWALYASPRRTWSPGKPHRHTWGDLYHEAHRAVIGGRQ
jgi:hypothetical protein